MSDPKPTSQAVSDIFGLSGAVDTSLDRARRVGQFWHGLGPEGWFAKNDEVDRRFTIYVVTCTLLRRRECEHWIEDARAVWHLILLDQFPRNVFRSTGHMFATDRWRPLCPTLLGRRFGRHIDPACVCLYACRLRTPRRWTIRTCRGLYQQYAPESCTGPNTTATLLNDLAGFTPQRQPWAANHRGTSIFGRGRFYG